MASFIDYAKPDRQEREAMHDGEPCIICGRKVRVGLGTLAIHLVDGGSTIAAASDDGPFDAASDLGWFPIGSDCAKRLPPSCIGDYTASP